ncbi:hypothetical protein B0A49_10697 [Cryomyces minteri]|uniref:CoA-binding domain-containing protein n=1 Tax=Cryomyces minteri TaxID=331657 RepID=A0A4U0WEG7_9PEZI|nr:hypothetical protein B0A49_10697 [Cryomyces minteri]
MLPLHLQKSLRPGWAIAASSRTRAFCAGFSSSTSLNGYSDTIHNLKIGKHTRVIYQGFTGKQATANAKDSIEYGTHIVGGVTPGRDGEHLGLPVLPTVKAAKEQLNPDATAIFVAAKYAAGAIEEAIEAEIPLIVAVAEHVPIHDMLRIHSILQTQSKSRLVGANAPGIISAIGRCRIGFQPLPTFSPGHIGIIAKSGTLSYESVASLIRAGLDALRVFEHDDDTEGIILVGELGGRAEEEAADWITAYNSRTKRPKPIAAVIGGIRAAKGRVMGHAGAFGGPGEISAQKKHNILKRAGVTMVDHPAKFGNVMKGLLAGAGKDVRKIKQSAARSQRRGMHTSQRILRRPSTAILPSQVAATTQRRGLKVRGQQAADLLTQFDNSITAYAEDDMTSRPGNLKHLCMTVDREARQPCMMVSFDTDRRKLKKSTRRFTFSYHEGPDRQTIQNILQHLQLNVVSPSTTAVVTQLIKSLFDFWKQKEAITISTEFLIKDDGTVALYTPRMLFDDAAFKSKGRQADVHALRNRDAEDPAELEAEAHGIVYIKLEPQNPNYNIGTLVNGAGLAMNTVDAIANHGGNCANFLDTGGKATSDTVKRSFEIILRDGRVKVIFVNIFGGLTDCGMIAEGVMLAFKELGLTLPVVVRLRGTREEVGQKMIAESGLQLHAFDDFEEAAEKVIQLAREEKAKAD